MDNALRKFEKRHKAVSKKHRELARGYVTRLGRNNVIEHHPMRHVPRVSWRFALLFISSFVAFKCFLVFRLGEAEYLARVAKLSEGSLLEQIGAWMMQIDPLTALAAGQVTLIFG